MPAEKPKKMTPEEFRQLAERLRSIAHKVGAVASQMEEESIDAYEHAAGTAKTRIGQLEGWAGRLSFRFDKKLNEIREAAAAYSIARGKRPGPK